MSDPTAVEQAERQHPAQAAVVHFDAAIDRALDRVRGKPLPDRIFYTATELGDFSLIWHLLATARGVRRGGDLEGTVRLVVALGIESALVNGPIKSIFRRTRPITDVPRPHRLRTPRTSSFPSGHASAAAVFVAMTADDRLSPVYVAAATTVAVSRIYVRIHHASDVVGGAVVGTAMGIAMRRWLPRGS